VSETKTALLIGASNPIIKKMNWTGKLIEWDTREHRSRGAEAWASVQSRVYQGPGWGSAVPVAR
jgi:hypothetical protein